jgi:hypothetical protein
LKLLLKVIEIPSSKAWVERSQDLVIEGVEGKSESEGVEML